MVTYMKFPVPNPRHTVDVLLTVTGIITTRWNNGLG